MIQPNPGVSVRFGPRSPSQGSLTFAIAPVPGGVGPLTNAILLTHLMRAARNQADGRVAVGSRALAPNRPLESLP